MLKASADKCGCARKLEWELLVAVSRACRRGAKERACDGDAVARLSHVSHGVVAHQRHIVRRLSLGDRVGVFLHMGEITNDNSASMPSGRCEASGSCWVQLPNRGKASQRIKGQIGSKHKRNRTRHAPAS